jgi:hypothetical protein
LGSDEHVPAPQLAAPVVFGFAGEPAPPPVGLAAAVPAGFAVDVVVAAAVVVAGVAVVVAGVVVGVALPPVVAAAALSAGCAFALQLAAALALGAAVALGVALAGVSDDFESPPHATMTAVVPSAAMVVARFVSERFGRMLMFSLFSS